MRVVALHGEGEPCAGQLTRLCELAAVANRPLRDRNRLRAYVPVMTSRILYSLTTSAFLYGRIASGVGIGPGRVDAR